MNYEKSILQQKQLLEECESKFKNIQSEYEKKDKVITGIFLSDLHIPYHDVKAWELTLKILKAIKPKKGFYSVQNDWNDLQGWSLKFEDTRPMSEKLKESDFSVIIDNEIDMIKQVGEVLPGLHPVQVLGNHDIRFYRKVRALLPGAGEWIVAKYMEALWDTGVMLFSRGAHMNWVRLAPDLIWHHGMSAAQLATTNAKKHISYFMEKGVASHVVIGHTHRASVIDGHSIGYNGSLFVNAPCLCMNKGVSYLPAGYAPSWQKGFAICEFFPHKRESRLYNIVFEETENNLKAEWRGKFYEVEK